MTGGPWKGEEEGRKLQGKGGGAEEGEAETGGLTGSQRVLSHLIFLFVLSEDQCSAESWRAEQCWRFSAEHYRKAFLVIT